MREGYGLLSTGDQFSRYFFRGFFLGGFGGRGLSLLGGGATVCPPLLVLPFDDPLLDGMFVVSFSENMNIATTKYQQQR